MKKLLNTLFVMTQGTYLAKEGESVVVRLEKAVMARFPVHNLGGIVCFGNIGCSPFLMGHCANNHVAISFLTENGKFLAKAVGKTSGNVLLRREQYRRTDDPEQTALIARNLVAAKIANCRTVLARGERDHPENMGTAEGEQVIHHLATSARAANGETVLEKIRGLEGDAANQYFGVFSNLLTSPEKEFAFSERTRRPPRDRMNALLSFLYVLLAHDVEGALESVGLDPQVGFLHRERPGRASLALDVMEPLRPVIADRLALTLVNRRQISADGFELQEGGAVLMSEKTRKAVLKAYQERKRDELVHPYLQEKIAIGLLPHVQALLLARCLRGDLPEYPAFVWR
jgi:CRISPR-associated protein Cas1